MREQLKRLDGILGDLRKVKHQMEEELKGTVNLAFLRSNDPGGDCATNIGFLFDNKKLTAQFAAGEGVGGALPINSGRHVYTNWEPIMNKRGACHPAMNPYSMPANQGLNDNYSMDMCPRTLDLLNRTVYIGINPDWSQKEIENKVQSIKDAAKAL